MSVSLKIAALLVAFASLLSSTTVIANHESGSAYPDRSYDAYRPLGVYLGGGFGFGGNEVGRFSDGNGEIEKVRGGGGVLLEGGLLLAVDPSTALRFTAGYQADGVSRLNGDSTFDRLRFDLTIIRAVGPHELGVGVTTHTSVGYDCNISAICAGDIEFNSAVGYTLEYAINLNSGYLARKRYRRGRWNGEMAGLRLGLRFTGIEYTPRLANIESSDIVDGTTLTAFVGVSF